MGDNNHEATIVPLVLGLLPLCYRVVNKRKVWVMKTDESQNVAVSSILHFRSNSLLHV